jgi:large subunit ribosomal protein L24
MKILKNDKVYVITGKDKGKTGEVTRVISKKDEVVVAGINIAKKAVKPSKKNAAGGIMEVTRPVPVSNVVLFCPKCGKPARIGYLISKDGKKSRICKKCKAVVKEQ